MKALTAILTCTALLLGACGEAVDSTDPSDIERAPDFGSPGTGGETPLATGSDDVVSGPLGDETITRGVGPGISVADLSDAALRLDGPFLVNGFVFVDGDGSAVISDAVDESYPPKPAGTRFPVEGFDLMQLPLVEGTADSASWTEQPVQLIGDLIDGVFMASPSQ